MLMNYIYQTTKCSKLRFLQCRILNKKLTTNIKRSQWNNEVSLLCTFCGNTLETVLHIMLEGRKTKPLWKALNKWLKRKGIIERDLTDKEIM